MNAERSVEWEAGVIQSWAEVIVSAVVRRGERVAEVVLDWEVCVWVVRSAGMMIVLHTHTHTHTHTEERETEER
jgi:hypothetical protein